MARWETPIENYLCSKNQDLYNSLADFCTVILFRIDIIPPGFESRWFCMPQHDIFQIFYYQDTENTGFLTHELFHIDLIRRGYSDNGSLIAYVQKSPMASVLELLFSTESIQHINNIFAHNRFYDDFLARKYEPAEFTADYDIKINVEEIIKQINADFGNKTLPNNSMSAFINSYFLVKDKRNPKFKKDVKNLMAFFRNTNLNLFQILDSHWAQWENSTTLNNYEILTSLFDEVGKWYRSL